MDIIVPERDGPDSTSGGYVTAAAKRDSSLDRLGGGYIMGAKRDDSLDRLDGGIISLIDDNNCDDDEDGCGRAAVAAKRDSSLDRLGGGHIMNAKRDNSIDRLGGGYIMGAKRESSLDRLVGGHIMGTKRNDNRPDSGSRYAQRVDGFGPLVVIRRGDGPSVGHRRTEYRRVKLAKSDYGGCHDCDPSAESPF